MNDHHAMIAVVEQERLADPAQVGLGLFVERNAGADTGVNEEIVAETAAIGEGLLRNFTCSRGIARRTMASASPWLAMPQLLRVDAVALQAFGSRRTTAIWRSAAHLPRECAAGPPRGCPAGRRSTPGRLERCADRSSTCAELGPAVDQVADEHQRASGPPGGRWSPSECGRADSRAGRAAHGHRPPHRRGGPAARRARC